MKQEVKRRYVYVIQHTFSPAGHEPHSAAINKKGVACFWDNGHLRALRKDQYTTNPDGLAALATKEGEMLKKMSPFPVVCRKHYRAQHHCSSPSPRAGRKVIYTTVWDWSTKVIRVLAKYSPLTETVSFSRKGHDYVLKGIHFAFTADIGRLSVADRQLRMLAKMAAEI